MKRVLVTGASGFIGQSLVAALAHSGYAVRAATRRALSFANTNDVAVVPDFSGTIDWRPILSGVEFVVHTAALVHADAGIGAELFDRINRAATQELAAAAARAGVERLIFISSIRAQIGISANYVVTEADEPQPTNLYGTSKLAGERALRATGVPFTIFRPVAIYGPRAKGNVSTLMRIASLPLPLPFGALTNRRSLLAIDNLIAAILFALNNPTTVGETYVVADAEPISMRDMFSTLRAALGRPQGQFSVSPKLFERFFTVLNRQDVWERLGCELVVNPEKLMSTGWRPIIDTYSGLTATAQAFAKSKNAV